jgi:hypothetical protein
MADNNLDDFFAKKDKKKKGTKKFAKANTDVVAKGLIETERKELKEMEKSDKVLGTQISADNSDTPQKSQEDEEWEEYRENKKDLTGLKIEALTIQEPTIEPEEEETEINEDGEVVKVKKDDSGPWNKADGATTKAQRHQEYIQEMQKLDTSIQSSNVVHGSYVPPHLRGGAAAAAEQPKQARSRRGKMAAPDIASELNFPSLSSAIEEKNFGGFDDGGKFEEVRDRGGQNMPTMKVQDARISLGNRFAGLSGAD